MLFEGGGGGGGGGGLVGVSLQYSLHYCRLVWGWPGNEANFSLLNGASCCSHTCPTTTHTHTLPSGPPAPPHPTLELINATTLQLSWYPPFTWTGFPIQNYTVWMGNLTNSMNDRQDNIPINENNSNDTSVTFELSTINGEIARGCALLDFSVTARSDLGESSPGRVSGGFPIGWLLHVPIALFPERVGTRLMYRVEQSIAWNQSGLANFGTAGGMGTRGYIGYYGNKGPTWMDFHIYSYTGGRSHRQYFIASSLKYWRWERPGNEARTIPLNV